MKNLNFIKGTVTDAVTEGVDILLTPEDVKNLSTKNGFLAVSVRIGKDGKPYAYKATKRLAPLKVEVIDEVYDLARISVEEMPHNQLDAVSEAVYQQEYKEVNDHLNVETVNIMDIIAEVNRKYNEQ